MCLREGSKKPAPISILAILMKNLLPPNLSPVKSPHCPFCSTHTSHLHKTKSDEEIFDIWCHEKNSWLQKHNLKLRLNWPLQNFTKWWKGFLEPLNHVGRFCTNLWYSANKCQLLLIRDKCKCKLCKFWQLKITLMSFLRLITGTIYLIFKASQPEGCDSPPWLLGDPTVADRAKLGENLLQWINPSDLALWSYKNLFFHSKNEIGIIFILSENIHFLHSLELPNKQVTYDDPSF